MPDHQSFGHDAPDYELADELELDPRQMRVFADETRMAIIDLLSERAATTSQLAEALGKPKGTVGHHCKALREAGLIRVVRTKRVRAIEALYYGRTARTFVVRGHGTNAGSGPGFLGEAAHQFERAMQAGLLEDDAGLTTLRYARITRERAEEWERRLAALMTEFSGQPRGGDRAYALAVGLFPTDRPVFVAEDR